MKDTLTLMKDDTILKKFVDKYDLIYISADIFDSARTGIAKNRTLDGPTLSIYCRFKQNIKRNVRLAFSETGCISIRGEARNLNKEEISKDWQELVSKVKEDYEKQMQLFA